MTARGIRPARRRLVVAVGMSVLAVAVVGCGVPDNSDFEPIRAENIPFGLNETTTTTTSTTQLPTTTVAGSPPPSPTSRAETTTTVVDTEPVELYFVTGSSLDPRLTSITRALSRPAVLSQVISALEEGPPAEIGIGLRTVVPDDLVISVVEDGGVAVVELDDEAFGEVANSDQDALIAQLVLTLGQRPGVGQVQFTRGGEPFLVRVPSRGNTLSDDPVAADDFEALLTDAVNPPPTGVPTSTPPTVPTTTPATTTPATTTTARPRRPTPTTGSENQ